MSRRMMRIDKIPISKIIYNPKNIYGTLKTPTDIEWLASEFKARGQYINLPKVTHSVEHQGNYLVIGGESRIIAIDKIGDKYAECMVFDGIDESEAMGMLGADNAMQKGRSMIARSVEMYWMFVEQLKRLHDVDKAAKHVSLLADSTTHSVFTYVVPGWYLAHSIVINDFVSACGPKRQNIDAMTDLKTKLMQFKNFMLGYMCKVLHPLDLTELASRPPEQDIEYFDYMLEHILDNRMYNETQQSFVDAMQHDLSMCAFNRASDLKDRWIDIMNHKNEYSKFDLQDIYDKIVIQLSNFSRSKKLLLMSDIESINDFLEDIYNNSPYGL